MAAWVRSRLGLVVLTLAIASVVGATAGVLLTRTEAGRLAITVVDLPPGVTASITVSGPHGFARTVKTSTTLEDVPTGTYAIVNHDVATLDGVRYVAGTVPPVTIRGGETAHSTVGFAAAYPASTVVLGAQSAPSDSSVKAVTPNSVTLSGPQSASLRPGTFLVSGITAAAPVGFVRQIVSAQASNGATTLTTTPAQLVDAVPKGHIHVHADIRQGGIVHLSGLPSGGLPAPAILAAAREKVAAASEDFPFGSSPCDQTKAFIPAAHIGLTPHLDLDWDWGWASPDYLYFRTGFTEDISASVSVAGAISCNVSPPAAPVLNFAPIEFAIGPIPVVLNPQLVLDAKASASARAAGAVGVTQHGDCGMGFEYQHGTLAPIHGCSGTGFEPAGQLNAEVAGSLEFGPSFHLKIYDGLLGDLNASLTAYLTATGSVTADADKATFELDAGLRGVAGVDWDIAPYLSFKKDFPLFDAKTTLGR